MLTWRDMEMSFVSEKSHDHEITLTNICNFVLIVYQWMISCTNRPQSEFDATVSGM